MKIIKVKSCGECPYKRYDNGGGFTEPFHCCEKYGIILDDMIESENRWIDMDKEIHPECKLENI